MSAGHRPDVEAALRRRAAKRTFGPGPYVTGARFKPELTEIPDGHPFVRAVRDLPRFRPTAAVTIICGDNGAGKSTLIEVLAIAAGFEAQGGPLADRRTLGAAERAVVSAIEVIPGRHRPRSGFFLRAESFFNIAAMIDAAEMEEIYGGRPLHSQSHGESFLALASNRFGADGLFIFDEPEAALSVSGQLAFIAIIQRAVGLGSQFIFATHSPILLSFPGAQIYEAGEGGVEPVSAADTDAVRLTRGFLEAPERYLRHLGP